MGSYGRRIQPYFDCVVGEGKEDCMRKIAIGQADFTSVDAREAYVASRYCLICYIWVKSQDTWIKMHF